ncbi:MAG: HutP family protein [Clostridia bacterium]|nr:HutP family protein [Clostridia bacterium]MBQ4629090.1 HutP family protein [Clostridia bacterium]
MQEKGSRDVAQAAVRMAATSTREDENLLKSSLIDSDIKVGAVDFGGDFVASINKIIDRAVFMAKRDNIISDSHDEEGSVAGAAHEAVIQIMQKAMGMNIGGKIAVARSGQHVAVAVFFGIGMLHLNEVAVGLGHRAIGNK